MVETVSPGSTTGTKVLYYGYQDHLGSLVALVRERVNGNGSISRIVADYRSYDAWGRLRDNDDWTLPRTTDLQITDRGYTGHEHLQSFGIINMNGRVYDPLTAQFFSPDPYVQAPGLWLNYNRYAYCLDNPLIYTDPDGELWWVPIAIGSAVFGTGNLITHSIKGDVNSLKDGLMYFGQGALVGAVLGTAWQFAPLIPVVGQGVQTAMSIYIGLQLGGLAYGTATGLSQGIYNGNWDVLENTWKIFLGNFYLDENRSIMDGVWQGISRHTWEIFQTALGYSYLQANLALGEVDHVDYFGGSTISTGEAERREKWNGVTLGNYSQIVIDRNTYCYYKEDKTSQGIYMHEFGHTIDSERLGPLYLLSVGVPSSISAAMATRIPGKRYSTHSIQDYETRANRLSAKYLKKYFGIDTWPYASLYPLNYP